MLLEKLLVVKGNRRLDIFKGDTLEVCRQPENTGGGVYSIGISVRGRKITLYGRLWRHEVFNMHNGDPTINIRVQNVKLC